MPDKKNTKSPTPSEAPAHKPEHARNPEMEELYRRLEPELRRPKPNPEAITAALEAAQRLAAEADAEDAMSDVSADAMSEGITEETINDMAAGLAADSTPVRCPSCGYENRRDSKFCGMCGAAVEAGLATSHRRSAEGKPAEGKPEKSELPAAPSPQFPSHVERPPSATPIPSPRPGVVETHHYHHHYHHHYFPGGHDAMPRIEADAAKFDSAREDKLRPTAAQRGDMSRAEAAVRRVTQEWVLACNTKHLDDLLDLYAPDAMVLRSNHPPVRGSAAIREFFFGALDAGLGEVEVEPLRVEISGDLAYEMGRCKALIPGATGKRREERGKYLWVCARQSGGEWKLAADCWSSDLTLTQLESDIPAGVAVKTRDPRKA